MTDAILEELCREFLKRSGDDPRRPGLERTPVRYASALKELTSGYRQSAADIAAGGIFESPCEQLVSVRDIEFHSMCEHHLLPFFGRVTIAYVPHGRIIGLSRLPELVQIFARRLQIQERLGEEIAGAMEELLSPRGVALRIEARHFCLMIRGDQPQSTELVTNVTTGVFKSDPGLRQEFSSICRPRA